VSVVYADDEPEYEPGGDASDPYQQKSDWLPAEQADTSQGLVNDNAIYDNSGKEIMDAKPNSIVQDAWGKDVYVDAGGDQYNLFKDNSGKQYGVDENGEKFFLDKNNDPYSIGSDGKPIAYDMEGNPLTPVLNKDMPGYSALSSSAGANGLLPGTTGFSSPGNVMAKPGGGMMMGGQSGGLFGGLMNTLFGGPTMGTMSGGMGMGGYGMTGGMYGSQSAGGVLGGMLGSALGLGGGGMGGYGMGGGMGGYGMTGGMTGGVGGYGMTGGMGGYGLGGSGMGGYGMGGGMGGYGMTGGMGGGGMGMAGLPSGTVTGVVATFLQWLLGIFGLLALISFLISGIMYFSAVGNKEDAEKAKKNMEWSIIGVIVGLAGLIIVNGITTWLSGSSFF